MQNTIDEFNNKEAVSYTHLDVYKRQIRFKHKGQTNEVQGISFSKGEYTFKGSEIDRRDVYKRQTDNRPRRSKRFVAGNIIESIR